MLRKLSAEEIRNTKVLEITGHGSVCMMTKEIKELEIKSIEDVKEMADMLETYNWIAIYAISNENSITVVMSRI